eukprot:NODE_31_length_37178_cov_0.413576.p4 type:complete len:660 gc:universal NODE_31_length_37178_cov_0.413576:11630-13609(+)
MKQITIVAELPNGICKLIRFDATKHFNHDDLREKIKTVFDLKINLDRISYEGLTAEAQLNKNFVLSHNSNKKALKVQVAYSLFVSLPYKEPTWIYLPEKILQKKKQCSGSDMRKYLKDYFQLNCLLSDIELPQFKQTSLKDCVFKNYNTPETALIIMVPSFKNIFQFDFQDELECISNRLHVSSKIFLRDCYGRICDEIFNAEKENLELRKKICEVRAFFYLTGTLGIGKTAFTIYLINKLKSMKREIFFGSKELAHFVYWNAKGGYEIVPETDFEKYSVNDKIFFIFDSIEYKASVLGTCLISSSPRSGIAKQFRKIATKLYMPIWSWEEIQKLYDLRYSTFFTRDIISCRYLLLGGVPRLIFNFEENNSSIQVLNDAVSNVGSKKLKNFHESVVSDEVLHKVIQVHCPEYTDSLFGNFELKYASDFVTTLVLQKFKKDYFDRVNHFLNDTIDVGMTGGLRGNLHEQLGHIQLWKGDTFQCRNLKTSNVFSFNFPSSTLLPISDNLSDLQAMQWEENIYYKPISKCFECLDSFLVKEGELWGFQFISSKNHIITSALYWCWQNCDLKHYVVVVDDYRVFEKYSIRDVKPSKIHPFSQYNEAPSEFNLKHYIMLINRDKFELSVRDLRIAQETQFTSFVKQPWSKITKSEFQRLQDSLV